MLLIIMTEQLLVSDLVSVSMNDPSQGELLLSQVDPPPVPPYTPKYFRFHGIFALNDNILVGAPEKILDPRLSIITIVDMNRSPSLRGSSSMLV